LVGHPEKESTRTQKYTFFHQPQILNPKIFLIVSYPAYTMIFDLPRFFQTMKSARDPLLQSSTIIE
jgi:hypothetical protein